MAAATSTAHPAKAPSHLFTAVVPVIGESIYIAPMQRAGQRLARPDPAPVPLALRQRPVDKRAQVGTQLGHAGPVDIHHVARLEVPDLDAVGADLGVED